MLDSDIKIFIAITLNFYIVVNKSYLYNYSEKINYSMIENELENIKNNKIKYIEIVLYMMKINNK